MTVWGEGVKMGVCMDGNDAPLTASLYCVCVSLSLEDAPLAASVWMGQLM